MKTKPKVEIELNHDHAVPEFAKQRVEDFLTAWNPNYMPFTDFVTSLYMQGLCDGFEVGEGFTKARLARGRESVCLGGEK